MYQSRNYKDLIQDKSSQIKEDIEEDISSKDGLAKTKGRKYLYPLIIYRYDG
jgi:hypothetical protein